jgi:hypothetical protein
MAAWRRVKKRSRCLFRSRLDRQWLVDWWLNGWYLDGYDWMVDDFWILRWLKGNLLVVGVKD